MKSLTLIGWKENIALPMLGGCELIAKIDTGAKLSALHATAILIDGNRVSFSLSAGRFETEITQMRKIKSSNGSSNLRPIIETEVEVGEMCFYTEISLTDRTDMDLPMLLGRAALRRRFLVNPGRTFLLNAKI